MGFSNRKYLQLLLPLHVPPICTHELRNLTVYRLLVSWVLSSPNHSGSQGGQGGTESGSLCPNLGRFGCDDKDKLITVLPMRCLKASAERNARAAALHGGPHAIR